MRFDNLCSHIKKARNTYSAERTCKASQGASIIKDLATTMGQAGVTRLDAETQQEVSWTLRVEMMRPITASVSLCRHNRYPILLAHGGQISLADDSLRDALLKLDDNDLNAMCKMLDHLVATEAVSDPIFKDQKFDHVVLQVPLIQGA